MNADQIKALSSIREQLESEGIQLVNSTTPGAVRTFSLPGSLLETVNVPSGIDHTIRAMIDTSTLTYDNGAGAQSVAVTLVDSDGNVLAKVPDYNISIQYRFVDGSGNMTSGKFSIRFYDTKAPTVKSVSVSAADGGKYQYGQSVPALESGKTEYTVSVKDMTNTFVSATTEDPDAKVTVNGIQADLGNILINLRHGINNINIKVIAADGVTVKNYTVKITNAKTGSDSTPSDEANEADKSDKADKAAVHYIADDVIAKLIKEAASNKRILIKPYFTGNEEPIQPICRNDKRNDRNGPGQAQQYYSRRL